MANLRDARIIRDYVVAIQGVGQIGEIPMFTPPDIDIEVEDYRGAGMDGTVEIPMGINKIEMSFDMFTWNETIWENLGYGVGAMDVPVSFYGYTMTASGNEDRVIIDTLALLKSIKTGSVEPGKMVKMSVSLSCRTYTHTIGEKVVTNIDLFNSIFVINGVDKSARKRGLLGFTY